MSLKRSTILCDYIYLQEREFDTRLESDPKSFQEVKQYFNSEKWIKTIKEEMKFMTDNNIWKLVKLFEEVKLVNCKIKLDLLGNDEKYKTRLIAKGFT